LLFDDWLSGATDFSGGYAAAANFDEEKNPLQDRDAKNWYVINTDREIISELEGGELTYDELHGNLVYGHELNQGTLGFTASGDKFIALADTGEIICRSLSEIDRIPGIEGGSAEQSGYVICKSSATNMYGLYGEYSGDLLMEIDYEWISPKYETDYPYSLIGFDWTRGAQNGSMQIQALRP